MRKYFIALLTIICIPLLCDANEEKIYVEPRTVYVAPNGIFLDIDGELHQVNSISSDENGIYIPSPEAGYCGKHGYYPGSSTVCPRCLAEKKKKDK